MQYQGAAAAAKSLQSCPTLCDPIRRQPTRLPRPWDSPGKNTGMGNIKVQQCSIPPGVLKHDHMQADGQMLSNISEDSKREISLNSI